MNRVLILATIIFTVALMSCSESTGSSSEGLGDGPITVKYSSTLQSQILADGMHVTFEPQCSEGGVYAVLPDTGYQQVANGTMFSWDSESCDAGVFHGTSSTVFGTWTFDGEVVAVPGGASEGCEPSEMENIKATMVITETTTMITIENELCWSELYREGMLNSLGEADSANIKTHGCNALTWLYKGKTAQVALTSFTDGAQGFSQKIEFNVDGKSCIQNILADVELSEQTCATAWQNYVATGSRGDFADYNQTKNPGQSAEAAAFRECLDATGFGKTASALSKIAIRMR